MQAAFRRSDALEALESYALPIVMHLSLLQFFPEHSAVNHWQAEVQAFEKALLRYSNSKKKSPNLDSYLVQKFLEDELFSPSDEEKIENFIHAKGLPLNEDPNWDLVRKAIQEFAGRFR